MDTGLTPKRIGILGFDGVTASHVAASADAFTAAALDNGYGGRIPCYEVYTVGLISAPFQTESGTIFKPQKTIRTAPAFDTILIPGGSGLRRSQTAEVVSDWILRRSPETRRIAAICTGIYGLAPTGLLDGREVTTHWRFSSDVSQRFPRLKVNHKQQLLKDGPFYTSAGLNAGMDVSLLLIEEDYGPQVGSSLRRELVTYLARRTDGAASSESSHFNSQPMDRFAELVAWIVRNLNEDLSVEALARRACMCPRHFNRAFKSVFGTTPAVFVENLRLNEARRRLSTRNKTLQSVGVSVGFTNTGAFQRAFERRFGSRPGRYLDHQNTTSRAVATRPGAVPQVPAA